MNTVAFFSLGFRATVEDEFHPAVTYNQESLIYVLLKMKYTIGLRARGCLLRFSVNSCRLSTSLHKQLPFAWSHPKLSLSVYLVFYCGAIRALLPESKPHLSGLPARRANAVYEQDPTQSWRWCFPTARSGNLHINVPCSQLNHTAQEEEERELEFLMPRLFLFITIKQFLLVYLKKKKSTHT